MSCGRRIVGWLRKECQVGELQSVWQIGATVTGVEVDNACVLKTLSGSVLLTDGQTLISAEDPHRKASEIFWTRASTGESESEFILLGGETGTRLHATLCDACPGLELGQPGPWAQVLPFDRLELPKESSKEAAILWYPGSFAPFHLGHLNCLRVAKEVLSRTMYIAGAYIQPHPLGHLTYKKLEDKSSILATDAVRLKVLEDVISKEDWVMVDPRAILRGKGSNLEHLKALRRNLQAAREHVLRQSGDVFKSLEIIWVMGDDAFPHFRQKFIENPQSWHKKQMDEVLREGKFRLCVVHNRPSQRTHIDPAGLPFEVLEADAPPELSADLSATALRKAWLEGADDVELSKFLGSREAASYLCRLR